MYKCRITVIKKCLHKELAAEYGEGGTDFPICPVFEVGDEYITAFTKPANFCEDAWNAIYNYVFALSAGSGKFYDDWVNREGIAISCCNDGLRPVIFKIERLNEEVHVVYPDTWHK